MWNLNVPSCVGRDAQRRRRFAHESILGRETPRIIRRWWDGRGGREVEKKMWSGGKKKIPGGVLKRKMNWLETVDFKRASQKCEASRGWAPQITRQVITDWNPPPSTSDLHGWLRRIASNHRRYQDEERAFPMTTHHRRNEKLRFKDRALLFCTGTPQKRPGVTSFRWGDVEKRRHLAGWGRLRGRLSSLSHNEELMLMSLKVLRRDTRFRQDSSSSVNEASNQIRDGGKKILFANNTIVIRVGKQASLKRLQRNVNL